MEVKKMKPILVATDTSKAVALTNGSRIMAAAPPSVGDKGWACLDQAGRFIRIAGVKLASLGVEKALLNVGYQVALPGDPLSIRLLDELAAREGARIIEEASRNMGPKLQDQFAEMRVQVIPFNASKPVTKALIRPRSASFVVAMGLGVGLSSGVVQVQYRPEDKSLQSGDIQINENWIAPEDADLSVFPRVSGYGGPAEEAAFLIQNVGMATLTGAQHLVCPEDAQMEDSMPRGRLTLQLPDGDEIRYGIDAGDELRVELWRNGVMTCKREGVLQIGGRDPLSVGNFASSIMAVLFLEAWKNQAAQSKRKMAKAA